MKKSMWAIVIVALLGIIALGASTTTVAKPAVQYTVQNSQGCCAGQAGSASATQPKTVNSECPMQEAMNCPAKKCPAGSQMTGHSSCCSGGSRKTSI